MLKIRNLYKHIAHKIWYGIPWLIYFFSSYIVLLKILAITNFLTTKPFQIKSFLWIQIILTRFYQQLLIYRLWSASGYYWLSSGDAIILHEYCFNRGQGLFLTVLIEAKEGQRGLLGSLNALLAALASPRRVRDEGEEGNSGDPDRRLPSNSERKF